MKPINQAGDTGKLPWKADGFSGIVDARGDDIMYYTTHDDGIHFTNKNDCELIVRAVNLIDALEELAKAAGGYVGDCSCSYHKEGKIECKPCKIDRALSKLSELKKSLNLP